MQSTADFMGVITDKYLRKTGECPECGGTMYEWRHTNADGSPRCQPTCMTCGYYGKGQYAKPKDDFTESLQAQRIKAVKTWSVVPNSSYFDKRLSNFKADTDELNALKLKAKIQVNGLITDKAHVWLTGMTGTGKSHLAMAILWEYLSQTKYQNKAMFISVSDYVAYRKTLINIKDDKTQQEFRQLENYIKTAELVVLDDLGAENGTMEQGNSATLFNVGLISEIINAREDKATVFTTNLSSSAIKSMYGERVYSRAMANSKDHILVFKGIPDYRTKGLMSSARRDG